jgi:phytoene dehydrogenase-like protein
MADSGPVLIVGAGLAGLVCAIELQTRGVEAVLIESADAPGGRVRTDRHDGFLLDRGFQVALTAYPEMHRHLDMAALALRPFEPGALIHRDGRDHEVGDPFRSPRSTLPTLRSIVAGGVGTPADLVRLALLRRRLRSRHPASLLRAAESPTSTALAAAGFSPRFIDAFFRPLVGGIQLDPSLGTSSRMFDVIMRMLLDGEAAVPAAGMGEIPRQLAARLHEDTLRLGSVAEAVVPEGVVVDGCLQRGSAVVIATDGPRSAELLGLPAVGSRSVGCVYFDAPAPPTARRLIVLDGERSGPALNVAVMSNVAPGYAPPDRHLVVAATPGDTADGLEERVLMQMRGWWGDQVDEWRHLRSYRIAHGQPDQGPPFSPKRSQQVGDRRFVCGDHRDTGSIQGAMFSGRRCAELVGRTLGAPRHQPA